MEKSFYLPHHLVIEFIRVLSSDVRVVQHEKGLRYSSIVLPHNAVIICEGEKGVTLGLTEEDIFSYTLILYSFNYHADGR